MKKFSAVLIALTSLIFFLAACSEKKATAASVAREWCDLNAKVYKAAEGPAKETAETARKKFEEDMTAKYKDDKAFMDEIENEVEKCEDASEN